MRRWIKVGVNLGSVLVDPLSSIRKALREPMPAATFLWLVILAAAISALCLPVQLELLNRALSPPGDRFLDLRNQIMAGGLQRLISIDRLLPPPTPVLAAFLLAGAADAILALPKNRRPVLWAVAFLGLAPILVQRLGEVAITYWSSPASGGLAEAVDLPRRFSTGPELLWLGESPPVWMRSLSQRVNLMSLWAVGLWTLGLRELEGRGFAPWHLALPLSVLAVATAITWWLTPFVIPLILGRP